MSTVPNTNVTLKGIAETVNGDQVLSTNIRMSDLYGVGLTTPTSGGLDFAGFRGFTGISSAQLARQAAGVTNTVFSNVFPFTSTNISLSDATTAFGYIWIAVRYSGIYRSTDAYNWSLIFSGDYFRVLATDNTLIAQSGSSSYTSYLTTDGANWTAMPGEQGNSVQVVSRLGSRVVIGLQGFSAFNGGLAYSDNSGASWTSISTIGGLSLINSSMTPYTWNGQFYAIGDSTSRKFSSADGANWTLLGTGTGSISHSGNQGWGGKLAIVDAAGTPAMAICSRNSNGPLITTDGINYASPTWNVGRVSWCGTVNGWRVFSPTWGSRAAWSATGQAWRNWPTAVDLGQYTVGYGNRIYHFTMPRLTSTAMSVGYWDFAAGPAPS
jgi:hypothetical protein